MMVTLFSRAASIKPSSKWSVYQAEISIWIASICATKDQQRIDSDRRRELTLACFSQGVGGWFAQSNVFRLSTLFDTLQCLDTLLQRRVRVNSVQVIQVGSGTQPLGGRFDRFVNMFRLVGHFKVHLRMSHNLGIFVGDRHTEKPHLEPINNFSLAPGFSLRNRPSSSSLWPLP